MTDTVTIEPWDAPEYVCGGCAKAFVPTDSQRRNRRWNGNGNNVSYCSAPCRHTAVGRKCRTPDPEGVDRSTVKGKSGPVRGPCKRCGCLFRSASPSKVFCSMGCYLGSDEFQTMVRENAKRINETKRAAAGSADPTKATVVVVCQHCGGERELPFSRRSQRFCNKRCRRGFYAARFDRWIANPESIALPQNYDEFLDRDELPCVIEGCGWVGPHLSQHCNHVHGVNAAQLKEMLGFNKGTGLCGRAFSAFLAGRPNQDMIKEFRHTGPIPQRPHDLRAEGRERARKASSLMANSIDPSKPPKPCRHCGKPVPQMVMGVAYYCDVACRDAVYRGRNRAKQNERKHPMACAACGVAFLGTDGQKAKLDAGQPVNCRKGCHAKKRPAQPHHAEETR